MRIRIALSLGAFLLAGGALMGTAIATAAPAQVQPPVATSTTSAPSQAPSTTRPAPTTAAPSQAQRPGAEPTVAPAPGTARVPRAIPAGPTGDLHLPAITEAN